MSDRLLIWEKFRNFPKISHATFYSKIYCNGFRDPNFEFFDFSDQICLFSYEHVSF